MEVSSFLWYIGRKSKSVFKTLLEYSISRRMELQNHTRKSCYFATIILLIFCSKTFLKLFQISLFNV
jgi:hypothetical protein